MVNVFSFCIYGPYNPKYYLGLKENVEIILRDFPSFDIYIYCGNDIDKDKFFKLFNPYLVNSNLLNKIHIINFNITGPILMLLRYLPIDNPNVDCIFSRDADSRIGERDKWCINRFLESPLIIHTIRDHHGHFVRMMGGLSAIKKDLLKKIGSIKNILPIDINAQYNYDQYILTKMVYIPYKDILLVHSTKNLFNDKNFEEIPLPVNKETFCGQVVDYKVENNELKPIFVYDYKPYD